MLIRYVAPDPRAGRVVRLAQELAEKTVAAGRAEEITEEDYVQGEAEKMAPSVPDAEPSSTRKGARKSVRRK